MLTAIAEPSVEGARGRAIDEVTGDADVYGELQYVEAEGEAPTVYACAGRSSFIIGRVKTCDITVAKGHVSATHCTVRREQATGASLLVDVSSNGTYLDGKLVGKTNEVPLSHGAVITFAKTTPYPRAVFTPLSGNVAPAKRQRTGSAAKAPVPRAAPDCAAARAASEVIAERKSGLEKQERQLRKAQEAHAAELASAREEAAVLRARLAQSDADAAAAAAKAREEHARALGEQEARALAALAEHQTERREAEEENAALRAEKDALDRALSGAREAEEAVGLRLKAVEEERSTLEAKVASSAAELASAREETALARAEAERTAGALDAERRGRAEHEALNAELRTKLGGLREAAEAQQQAEATLASQLRAAQDGRAAAEAERDAARRQAAEAEGGLKALGEQAAEAQRGARAQLDAAETAAASAQARAEAAGRRLAVEEVRKAAAADELGRLREEAGALLSHVVHAHTALVGSREGASGASQSSVSAEDEACVAPTQPQPWSADDGAQLVAAGGARRGALEPTQAHGGVDDETATQAAGDASGDFAVPTFAEPPPITPETAVIQHI